MRKKEICDCGKQIDKARQSLELSTCEDCARKIPGNILRDIREDPNEQFRERLEKDKEASCLKKYQVFLSDEERKELWDWLAEGYCRHCGKVLDTDNRVCHCTNDE